MALHSLELQARNDDKDSRFEWVAQRSVIIFLPSVGMFPREFEN